MKNNKINRNYPDIKKKIKTRAKKIRSYPKH